MGGEVGCFWFGSGGLETLTVCLKLIDGMRCKM